MDYLEEAMKDVQGCLGMDTYEGEQARATVSIANALIALVERLEVTAQDGVGKEVDILSAVDARLKSGENRIGHIDKRSVLAGESIDALWKRFELSETDYISLRDRLDALERKLPGGHELGVYGGPPEETQPLREKLIELMAKSKYLPGDFYCSLTVGERGDEMAQIEIALGDLRNMILAMNIKSGGAKAQWEKLEGANADIERHQRQLALRDKQVRELEGKVSKILEIVNDGEISFSDMRIEIIRATY